VTKVFFFLPLKKDSKAKNVFLVFNEKSCRVR